MTAVAILVDGFALLMIGLIVWYFFWMSRDLPADTAARAGVQGALIVVRGGYSPDTVVLERGRKARLIFRREESAICSEQVVLPAFGRRALLPEGTEVPIEFTPTERGEFPFSCHMGMLRGRIVVK